jgi:hypothetical protein
MPGSVSAAGWRGQFCIVLAPWVAPEPTDRGALHAV